MKFDKTKIAISIVHLREVTKLLWEMNPELIKILDDISSYLIKKYEVSETDINELDAIKQLIEKKDGSD